MTNPTWLPGNAQWYGLAKETTPGVPMAVPTIWVPVIGPKLSPKRTTLKDQALRGAMATTYGQVQGMVWSELAYQCHLYADSAYPHMMALLGSTDVVTGTTTAPTGTLSSSAAAGATSVSSSVSIPASTVIQIDVGGLSEVVTTTGAPTGAGPYTIPVPALKNAHASGVAITAVVAPFTHKNSLNNLIDATHNAQPTTYTGFLSQVDGTVQQIAGMVASDVKLTVKANEKPTLDVAWTGFTGATLTAPANTPTGAVMMPPTTGTVSFGGSGKTKYTSITVDMKRNVKPIPALTGTQNPLGIYAGPLTVTGSLDSVYQGSADTDFANWLANTQPAISVALAPAGDTTHPVTLQMSQVAYDSADPQPSATDWLTIQANFEAIANATDALDGKFSPIQAQMATTTSASF
jgi:hypothetical protein